MIRTLRTVAQFSEEHPAFSESALRWKIFNSTSNGMLKMDVIVKSGRRVLIDVDKFFDWLNSQQ